VLKAFAVDHDMARPVGGEQFGVTGIGQMQFHFDSAKRDIG
jgi:hypothetical protein